MPKKVNEMVVVVTLLGVFLGFTWLSVDAGSDVMCFCSG